MDSFFNKHRKEVQKLCALIATEISSKYNLDQEDIIAHLNDTMFKPPTLVRCEGIMKGNNKQQCGLNALANERFCRRHMWCSNNTGDDQDNNINDSLARCKGINKNGKQCMVRATMEEGTFCKKHMFQNTEETVETVSQSNMIGCIHFELDEEGQEEFICERNALPDKWCCKKHKSMNTIYTQLLKSSSPSAYITAIELGTRKKNDTIVQRIQMFI